MSDYIVDIEEPLGLGISARVTVRYLGALSSVPAYRERWEDRLDMVHAEVTLWLPVHKPEGQASTGELHRDIPAEVKVMGNSTGRSWGSVDGMYRSMSDTLGACTQRLAVGAALGMAMIEITKLRAAIGRRAERLALRERRLRQAEEDAFDLQAWRVEHRLIGDSK